MALSAKFEADFSSFYDAVTQATTQLVEFETGARSVEDRLQSMAVKFSGQKVIQEATLMAKAIEEAGGIATLTEAELARVGKTANEAAEKMRKMGMEVPANLQQLADATASVGEETQTLSVNVLDMVKAYVSAEAIIGLAKAAWSALIDVIQESITSATEAEQADRQLLAALEAQGTSMPSVVDAYRHYAAALQQTTIYSDDALAAATALLAQVGGVMPRDMEKALTATTNLAAGLGKELPEAAMLMAKAATGSTEALNKYGIETTDADGKALGFAETLDVINSKFSGAATAAADTYAGRIAQMGNAWDNAKESIGRVIVQNDTVRTMLEQTTKLINLQTGELNENAAVNTLVSNAVILFAKGLGLAAEAANLLQQKVTEARIAVDLIGIATGKYHGQTAAFVTDLAQAARTSQEWAAGNAALQANLAALVKELEPTIGKTRELTATQVEAKKVWDQTTGGMNAQLIAAADVAKGVAGLKTGFDQLGTSVTGWGLNSKLAFTTMQAASKAATDEIVTGADGAAAAVFKITTEVDGVTEALKGLSAVQSGAQLALPQGGGGAPYATGIVRSNVNPLLADELSRRYGGGQPQYWGAGLPSILGGSGGGAGVTLQSGAVTMNYPIVQDPQALDQLARVVGDAIMTRMTRTGTV